MQDHITHTEDEGIQTFSIEWAGKTLTIQTGKYAQQANSACTIQYGDTVVLATAVMGNEPREGMSYFPLLVDFEEKFYAAGKIKGSRFMKREGRPSDEAILAGRIIDRSIRPFFNQEMRIDVQVVVTTLSWDGENDSDTLAVIAAACALHISDIPWNGPIAAVRLNYVDGQWITNATYEQREGADLDLLVSVRENKAVMVEADGDEAPDELVGEGIAKAIEYTQPVLEVIQMMREKVGIEKKEFSVSDDDSVERKEALQKIVEPLAQSKIEAAFAITDKQERKHALDNVHTELNEKLKEDEEITKEERMFALSYVEKMVKKMTKELYLKQGKRIDGREFKEIRTLSSEVGVLPRTHGTGLFKRGETQALSILTLGSPSHEQILDTMEETDTKKRYMHHYNFPGFSVGEVRPNRGAGRREIGHGALAEKALLRMIPDKEEFPYTIRIVTEILSSNGSSSQAAVCGSTLALMDAGVPIKKPVAGIAMGIMTDDERPAEEYRIMTDIQGIEDHLGEMDFKIAGTDAGITAIQLDVKNTGVTAKMAMETITQAKEARIQILDVMKQVLPEPRKELSPYAPRIYTLRIDPAKIGDVIGPRGKIINEIIEQTGVAIDIEDDGLVMVTSTDQESADIAMDRIKDIVRDVEVGEEYSGKVTRLMDFGAFVEVLPGKEGLVHISEMAPWRVDKVTDIVKVGDIIPVKVTEIDREGRINLSLKQTNYTYPAEVLAKRPTNNNRSRNSQNDQRNSRKPHSSRDSRFNNKR